MKTKTFTGSSVSDLDDQVRRWRIRNPRCRIVGIDSGDYSPDGLQPLSKLRPGDAVARRVDYELVDN
jgi:hypothetical protein